MLTTNSKLKIPLQFRHKMIYIDGEVGNRPFWFYSQLSRMEKKYAYEYLPAVAKSNFLLFPCLSSHAFSRNYFCLFPFYFIFLTFCRLCQELGRSGLRQFRFYWQPVYFPLGWWISHSRTQIRWFYHRLGQK